MQLKIAENIPQTEIIYLNVVSFITFTIFCRTLNTKTTDIQNSFMSNLWTILYGNDCGPPSNELPLQYNCEEVVKVC